MKKLFICFILFLTYVSFAANPAYDKFIEGTKKSDFYIDLNKCSSSSDLKVSIYCRGGLKFCKYLSDYSFKNFSDYKTDNFYIYRKQDSLVTHFFDTEKDLSYDLGFSLDGTIDLSCGENHTGNNISYAIQTFGDIVNKKPISFYRLYTCGNSINNSSVLMIKEPYLLHHYYYNNGVLDFKNEFINGAFMNGDYLNLLPTFVRKKQAGYNFKKDSLDNEGIIISNSLRAGEESNLGFQINSSGVFVAENFKLCGQHNSVNVNGRFIVNDTFSGSIDNLNIGETIVKVGKAIANSIMNVNNRGNLILTEDNDLQIEKLDNLSKITGLKNLNLLVKTLNGNGVISAKGALRFISQAKYEIVQKLDDVVKEAGRINGILLGSEITVKHITDHYLNTITIYRDQHGHEISRSETGYIFQRREEIEKKVPMSQNEQNLLNKILNDTYKTMGELNNAFSALEQMEDAILKGMKSYAEKFGSSDNLIVNLRSFLRAQGMSPAQQTRMINNFMSIPYSCNALRLNANIASGISLSMRYKDFLQDLADLEYEKRAAAEKSKRKSWDNVRHVESMKSASRDISLESVIANATLMRYEFEQWKERNSEAYDAFLKTIDAWNNAALARAAGEAFMMAIPSRGASLFKFVGEVSLFAGVEYIANLISGYGADKVARYCAGEDMIKFASYLKTCEYFLKFVAEHGIIGGINRKLATANAVPHAHPTHETPIVNERRAAGVGTKSEVKLAQREERVILEYGKGKFWDGLIKDRDSAKTCVENSKKVDEILGRIQRAKKQIGGDIRADNEGSLYKFDKLHKTGKVHLEKIEEHEGKFWGTGEVNPESGEIEPIKWRLYK